MLRLNRFSGILLSFMAVLAATAPAIVHADQPLPSQSSVAQNRPSSQSKAIVARIWHGRTPTAKADEYYRYLNEAGIKKILAIPGNLGAQVLRRTEGNVTEFTVISYWESRDAIRKFAGNDIEKAHYLPKDREYLLELEPNVKHFDVLLDDRKQ